MAWSNVVAAWNLFLAAFWILAFEVVYWFSESALDLILYGLHILDIIILYGADIIETIWDILVNLAHDVFRESLTCRC